MESAGWEGEREREGGRERWREGKEGKEGRGRRSVLSTPLTIMRFFSEAQIQQMGSFVSVKA